MIKHRDSYGGKARKYSRKGFICSCECSIIISIGKTDHITDLIMVKYKIEPTGNVYIDDWKKYSWSTPTIWAKFKEIIEIPEIFSKMNDDEYIIYTSYFLRDKVQVPFIQNIEILNSDKYLLIKNQELRKKKLKNIGSKI